MTVRQAGKITFCFHIVTNEATWRRVSPADLSGAFNMGLAYLNFVPNAGPRNFNNSIVATFEHRFSIDSRYETVCQVWFQANAPFEDDTVKIAFINAWNQAVARNDPEYVFPTGRYGTITEGLEYMDGSRLWIHRGFKVCSVEIQPFTNVAPVFGVTSYFERLLMSPILTSNQPNLVGRELNAITLIGIANDVHEAAAPVVSAAAEQASALARAGITDAQELARNGMESLRTSGLLPFSTTELTMLKDVGIIVLMAGGGILILRETRKGLK